MKLIYFGTADFAVPALRRLAPHVCLVVSQPDRPSGRGLRLTPSPVKLAALELSIPVETPEKARSSEFVERVRSLVPDALLVAAYGQILSTAMLESAKRGGINLHGSILPKYRGAAPIQRAILADEAETGVTLMQMDKGMDTGDMIAVERTAIDPDETYGELQARLAEIGADMAEVWMPRIVEGTYPRIPQDDSGATMAPKVLKEEAELRFDMTAEEAYRRFRAFTPAPGAFIRTRFGVLRVRGAAMGAESEHAGGGRCFGEPIGASPGMVIRQDEVTFATGSLQLLEVQPEGKRPMSFRDFANGARLRRGDFLV